MQLGRGIKKLCWRQEENLLPNNKLIAKQWTPNESSQFK